MSCKSFLVTAFFIACVFLAGNVFSGVIISGSQDDGYSGRVVEKIIGKLNVPPLQKGAQNIRLQIYIDSDGKVSDCKIRKFSGQNALDKAICNAVYAAAPFGTPPYGVPAEIYFTFWSGDLKTSAPHSESYMNEQTALTDEERARALAESMAADAKTQNTAAVQNSSVYELTSSGQPVQKKYGAEYQKYLNKTVWKLRQGIYLPVESKPGTYYATVRINVDGNGKIMNQSILQSSGDERMDKYILKGIGRAGKIDPPPNGLGKNIDLVFKLIR